MQPLELAGERHIAIKDRGKLYRFTLSPITRELWMKYFDGIVSTSENRGDEQINVLDAGSPLLALVNEALIGAGGYKLPEGTGQINEIADWKAKLPFAHRLAVGQVLTRVAQSARFEDDEEAMMPGIDSVRLEALWNCDLNGVMALYRPLVHNFQTPQFEHERRYMRDQARSKVVGGSRTGKTVWMGVQRTLAEIYDELIESVEGYTFDGSRLGHPNITRCMDTYHKVVAARQLFSAPQLDPAEEAMEAA